MNLYLIAVHGAPEVDENGNYPSREAMERAHAATDAFNARLRAAGHWVFAGGLTAAAQGTVVDGRGAEVVVSDGPYLESKEHLAGFWIIDAPDRESALALAAEASAACEGTVEVRSFDGYSGA